MITDFDNLLLESNPDLDLDQVVLSDPKVITGGLTSTTIHARYGGAYEGDVVVEHDRLALETLMRGSIPEIHKSFRIPQGEAGTRVAGVYDILDEMTKVLGYPFTKDDVENTDIPKPVSHNAQTGKYESIIFIKALPTSRHYVGTFTLKWVLGGGKPHISQFFITDRLGGF